MCGKEFHSLRRATIEGTVMSVCAACVKFGVEIAGPKTEVTGRSVITQSLEKRATRSAPKDVFTQMQEELVPEYAALVRDARQRKGWTTKELANRMMESELAVKHVEAGSLHPPDTLVRKLERELGIKLMERPEAPGGPGSAGPKAPASRSLTLGDLLRNELEKGKKG